MITAKVTVGIDCQVKVDQVFVHLLGSTGCTARQIMQMIKRWRRVRDAEIYTCVKFTTVPADLTIAAIGKRIGTQREYAQSLIFSHFARQMASSATAVDGGVFADAFAASGLNAAPDEYCRLLQYHWREATSNFLRMFIYQCARYEWSIVVQHAPTVAEDAAATAHADVSVTDEREAWYAALHVRYGIVNNGETYDRHCRQQRADPRQVFVHRVAQRQEPFTTRKLTYDEYVVVERQARHIEQLALFMKFDTATLRARSHKHRAHRPMNDLYSPIAYTSIIAMQEVYAALGVQHLGALRTTVITREPLAEHCDMIIAACSRSQSSRGAAQQRRRPALPPAKRALRALNDEMRALFRVHYEAVKPLTTNAFEARSEPWTLAAEHDTI